MHAVKNTALENTHWKNVQTLLDKFNSSEAILGRSGSRHVRLLRL